MRTVSTTKKLARKPLDATLGRAVGSITEFRTDARQLSITFDDGPYPVVTEQLANVLARHNAHAVFFVLLTRVRKNPELVRELAGAGHEIALHGLDHRRITTLGTEEAGRWLRASQRELEDVLGEEVRWFRPPHGAQNVRTRIQSARLGLTTVLWSGTTWDWKDIRHEERIAKAMADARPGAILLAHDGSADASDLASEAAVQGVNKARLLNEVLDGLAARELQAVTLTEALRQGKAVKKLSFSR